MCVRVYIDMKSAIFFLYFICGTLVFFWSFKFASILSKKNEPKLLQQNFLLAFDQWNEEGIVPSISQGENCSFKNMGVKLYNIYRK